MLSKSQLGFQKGNRTSDARIIIRNLVDKYCHKNGKRVYSCFIDLSKAFDIVPRDILSNKLLKLGINGKSVVFIQTTQLVLKLKTSVQNPSQLTMDGCSRFVVSR